MRLVAPTTLDLPSHPSRLSPRSPPPNSAAWNFAVPCAPACPMGREMSGRGRYIVAKKEVLRERLKMGNLHYSLPSEYTFENLIITIIIFNGIKINVEIRKTSRK